MNGRIKQILVLQETRKEESRVALTPSAVALMPLHRKYQILVESGAGLYRNNLKNRNFGKEVHQSFDLERETIAEMEL